MTPEYIPLALCVPGHLYKVDARSYQLAVFDGNRSFTGIREKFGGRGLFTEFHWDTGEPWGTVKPLVDLGQIPDGIEPISYIPHDRLWHARNGTDKVRVIRRDLRPGEPPHGRRRGYVDEYEDGTRLPDDRYPAMEHNTNLFNYLETITDYPSFYETGSHADEGRADSSAPVSGEGG